MDIQPLEILKWIGIVLVAGFVGYFGRYLAMLIIDRLHKKEHEAGQPKSQIGMPSNQQFHNDESLLKLEKKRAKQEIKKAKKTDKG